MAAAGCRVCVGVMRVQGSGFRVHRLHTAYIIRVRAWLLQISAWVSGCGGDEESGFRDSGWGNEGQDFMVGVIEVSWLRGGGEQGSGFRVQCGGDEG